MKPQRTANRFFGYPWCLLPLFLLLGGAISLLRGQDNWWDLANYHIYNPWSLLHHRWGKDLFAAGTQGYFHPGADIPYYLLAMEWLPSHPRVVGFLAGLPYGCLVFVVFLIVRHVFASAAGIGRRERTCLVVATTTLAVTGVSAWSQAGTTTNEVTVATLVLLGTYLLLTVAGPGDEKSATRRFLAIGALMGVAAGLKLTAATYVPAMGLAIVFQQRSPRAIVRAGVLFVVGCVVAFAVVYGPWAWHLYKVTGNPLFPNFSNVFASPFAATINGRDMNFLPTTLGEWIFYPFYWLDAHHPSVYNRLLFRDGRVAAFYLTCLAFVVAAWRARVRDRPRADRNLTLLVFFCVVSYVLWLVVFSMLRYAIVIEALASVATIAMLVHLLAGSEPDRYIVPRSWAVVVLTCCLLGSTRYPDVPRIAYGSRTFSATTPPLPKDSLVVLANQPMGLLAPFIQAVNPSATFLGVPECFLPDRWCNKRFLHYGLGDRMRQKLASHRGPLFVAYYTSRNPPLPQLSLFGIQVFRGQCLSMKTNTTGPVSICPARLGSASDAPGALAQAKPSPVGEFHPVFPSTEFEKRLKLSYRSFERNGDGALGMVPLPPSAAGHLTVALTVNRDARLHLDLDRPECKTGVDFVVQQPFEPGPVDRGHLAYPGKGHAADVVIKASRYPAPFVLSLRMPPGAPNNWYCNVSAYWMEPVSRSGSPAR